jgi:Uma2 family endonuclease
VQTIDFAELSRLSDELDARKPYVELIDGVRVPKVSPRTRHSMVQAELLVLFRIWALGRGRAGTEWRLWLVPTGGQRSSLVPDVAYVSQKRLDELGDDAYEMPPFAPDVAVEVRSPGDRRKRIERKIELYLSHGAHLVLDVDPRTRTIFAHDEGGLHAFRDGDRFEHVAVPGLEFEVRALFDAAGR